MRIKARDRGTGNQPRRYCDSCRRGLVLLEMVIVIGLISILFSLATISLSGALERSRFKKDAHDFINILIMAQNAAAETRMRYVVNVDFQEQSYELRAFKTTDWEVLLEEELPLTIGYFSEDCFLEYVKYDDGIDTRDPIEDEDMVGAWLFAGHSGWQNAAVIGLLDVEGNPWSIKINRLSRIIELMPGEIELLEPKYKEDVPF